MRLFPNLALPMLTSVELEEVIRANAVPRTVLARTTFISADSDIKGVYYIRSGRTRHYLLGADGSEKIIFILTAGWFFGEASCYLQYPLNLYVMAEERTELYFIPEKKFRSLLLESSLFNEAVMHCYTSKMVMMIHEIENLSFNSSKDRLLYLFYTNADTSFAFDGKWYPLKHNYTQQELGALLGVSRVTISKFVNEFCDDGIIRIVNRRTQINIRHYNRIDGLASSQ